MANIPHSEIKGDIRMALAVQSSHKFAELSALNHRG